LAVDMLHALLVTILSLLRLLAWPLQRLSRRPVDVLRISIRGSLPALPERRRLPFGRKRALSVLELEGRLGEAKRDENLEHVLVIIGGIEASWPALESLRAALDEVVESGKRLTAFLPDGGSAREYYLACAASEIYTAPASALMLTGLGVESTYFAHALEKVGAKAQVVAAGRFKSAGEVFVRRSMSQENTEVVGEILDDVEDLLLESATQARRLGPDRARELLGGGPYGPEEALRLGLIDGVCYGDSFGAKLAREGERRAVIRPYDSWRRGRVRREIRWPWERSILPIVEVHGVIVDGQGPGLSGVVGAKSLVKLLNGLRHNRQVNGVVLHIDSRGGTVLGSDQIRRSVERLAQKKPVVAFMDGVAASGGYMVAAAAHQVVTERTTLTGSVGVIAAKITAGGLLERLGLHRSSIIRGKNSSFGSATAPWTASERTAMRSLIDEYYRYFVDVVARGRRMPVDQIETAAHGRVWTGRRAVEIGLADHLGGLGLAVETAREAMGGGKRARVVPMRPKAPRRLPSLPLPGATADVLIAALLASRGEALALLPSELRIR